MKTSYSRLVGRGGGEEIYMYCDEENMWQGEGREKDTVLKITFGREKGKREKL
jgi:hypothetical protein